MLGCVIAREFQSQPTPISTLEPSKIDPLVRVRLRLSLLGFWLGVCRRFECEFNISLCILSAAQVYTSKALGKLETR